jgi:hypothetical protein
VPDEAAAAAAIDACRRAAAAVDDAAEARRRAALAAQAGWRGPAREVFDADLVRLQREAADLAADLRATAGSIQVAWDEARAWSRSSLTAAG